jgi:hypothetical protein
MFGADILGEVFLELQDPWSSSALFTEDPALENLNDGFDLFLSNRWLFDRYHVSH